MPPMCCQPPMCCPQMCCPFFLLSKPKNQDATVFELPVLLPTIQDQKKRGCPQFFRMAPIIPYLFSGERDVSSFYLLKEDATSIH